MRFRVLGPVEIESDDGQLHVLVRRRERCLLAILLLEAGRVVPVDRLCQMLWDDNPPAAARRSVHSHVARIRAVMAKARAVGPKGPNGGAELISHRDGYLLRVDPMDVDVHRFRALARQAAETDDLTERDRLLREALGLWRGPALHGATTSDGMQQRLCGDLEEQRLQAIEESLATGLELGRHAELLPELVRLHAEYPVRDRVTELRMLALHRQGRTADALEVYRETRTRVVDELGLDPGPALQRLHQAILRGEAPPTATPAPRPTGAIAAQLPADVVAFTGRTGELAQLDGLLDPATTDLPPARPTTVVISTVSGTAGVGKTALAVHWSQRVRHRFPDGQLYVNLRGFHPAEQMMTPAEAIGVFLHALGTPPDGIPPDLDARVGLYRSLLSGKRLLILLDNARDAEQVRPLLPGSARSFALVTSRNPLTGLVVADGAHPLVVDVMSTVEARDFLVRRLGPDRVNAEPDAVDQIIDRCARLPLALAIAAARALIGTPLASLAAELGESATRLDALDTDDAATQVRAVFSWSYRALTPGAAQLFRLLGLHPGPDLSPAAAASLAGVPLVRARELLAELIDANLIIEPHPGRYAFHDLLRAYAAELTRTTDSEEQRHIASRRLLDHYLHTAYRATELLERGHDGLALAAPEPGVTEEYPSDYAQGLDWFTVERPVLLAAVQHAAGTGLDIHAWQLAWTMTVFLDRQGHWQDWATVARAALAATERLGDRHAQARSHRLLSGAYLRLTRYDEAHIQMLRALEMFGEVGDGRSEAVCHRNLAQLMGRQGRPAEALHHARQSLDLYRVVGDRREQASVLNTVGWFHSQVGEYQQTIAYCEEALAILQEHNFRPGQADTWDSLGYAHHGLGNHHEAITCYQHAADLYRDLGHAYEQADTLVHLGDSHHAAGQLTQARDRWRQALDIFTDLNHADADAVRARLQTLDSMSIGPSTPTAPTR